MGHRPSRQAVGTQRRVVATPPTPPVCAAAGPRGAHARRVGRRVRRPPQVAHGRAAAALARRACVSRANAHERRHPLPLPPGAQDSQVTTGAPGMSFCRCRREEPPLHGHPRRTQTSSTSLACSSGAWPCSSRPPKVRFWLRAPCIGWRRPADQPARDRVLQGTRSLSAGLPLRLAGPALLVAGECVYTLFVDDQGGEVRARPRVTSPPRFALRRAALSRRRPLTRVAPRLRPAEGPVGRRQRGRRRRRGGVWRRPGLHHQRGEALAWSPHAIPHCAVFPTAVLPRCSHRPSRS